MSFDTNEHGETFSVAAETQPAIQTGRTCGECRVRGLLETRALEQSLPLSPARPGEGAAGGAGAA